MSMVALAQVDDPTVKIALWALSATSARLELSGVLGHRDPGPLLAPMFAKLDKLVRETQRSKVIVDLRSLRFMNSASFKHFVGWIKANDAQAEGRYAIHFVLSPAHHWQEVSIHALSCFSMVPITVENGSDQVR
jgi:hypothetical protein